jgi:hypothetical protein
MSDRVGNYVSVTPLQVGNFMSADTIPMVGYIRNYQGFGCSAVPTSTSHVRNGTIYREQLPSARISHRGTSTAAVR